MRGYRLYFVDKKGAIQAREEFFAPDDDVALGVACMVCRACSDTSHAYELWQGGRQVVAFDRPRSDIMAAPTDQQAIDIQQITLTVEEALQRSRWLIARSEKLITEIERLKGKVNTARNGE